MRCGSSNPNPNPDPNPNPNPNPNPDPNPDPNPTQVVRCLANLLVLEGCREHLLACGGLR